MSALDKLREWFRRHDGKVEKWTATDQSLDTDMDYPPTMAEGRERKNSGRRWFGLKVSWRW